MSINVSPQEISLWTGKVVFSGTVGKALATMEGRGAPRTVLDALRRGEASRSFGSAEELAHYINDLSSR